MTRTENKWMSYNSSVKKNGRDSGRVPSKILIIGLGNPILGDDGVGWRVAEDLRIHLTDTEIDCLSLGGLSLMERLIGYDTAIVIDSIQTGNKPTGQVYTFLLEDLPNLSSTHTTAVHDTSLATALKLGRAMGARLPDTVMIVAVETARIYDFSNELSPEVSRAVPKATRAVLKLLGTAI